MSISGCDAIPVLWRQPTKEVTEMKILSNMRSLLVITILGLLAIAPAKATLITVDMLTDTQIASSTGPIVTNTLSAAQLPGAAPFIFSRTLSAQNTSGLGLVTASVSGGVYGCDRSLPAVGPCKISYLTSQPITLDQVFLDISTDATGVGSAGLELLINSVSKWTHTMMAAHELINISFAQTNFAAGTNISFLTTGIAATDFSALGFKINVPDKNRVPEPGSLTLAGLGLVGLFGSMKISKRRTTRLAKA